MKTSSQKWSDIYINIRSNAGYQQTAAWPLIPSQLTTQHQHTLSTQHIDFLARHWLTVKNSVCSALFWLTSLNCVLIKLNTWLSVKSPVECTNDWLIWVAKTALAFHWKFQHSSCQIWMLRSSCDNHFNKPPANKIIYVASLLNQLSSQCTAPSWLQYILILTAFFTLHSNLRPQKEENIETCGVKDVNGWHCALLSSILLQRCLQKAVIRQCRISKKISPLTFERREGHHARENWVILNLKESVSALNLEIVKTWMFSVSSARLWNLKTQEAHTGQVHESREVRRGTMSALPPPGPMVGRSRHLLRGPVGFICNAPPGHGG